MPTTFLAIGSTGLGKSTFGQLLCNVPTIVSSGTSSTICEATLYENNSFRYIDTPGFNDSGGTTDEETFHQILRLLQEHSENGVFEVHKILWFCAENERKAANLQNEAKFIQRLVEYVEEVGSANLWKNVIIITKGNFPEEGLANGPKSAAYDAMRTSMTKNNRTNVEDKDEFIVEDEFIIEGGEQIVDHFPCWIFDLKPGPNKFTKMKPEVRAHLNAYSKEEVVTALQGHIRNDTAIKIQFEEAYCTKCSEKGDPRLFIGRCHPLQARKHEIETERYHPKSADWQHKGKRIQRHWKPEDGEIPAEGKLVDGTTVGAVSSTLGSLGAGAYILNAAAAAQPGIIFGGTAIAGTIALPIVAAVGLAAAGGYCINEKLKENYKCPYCKKFYNEKGCLEECDDCGKEWDGKGCISKYLCCNKCEEEDGCTLRERCKNCDQTEYKLTTEGCIEYCQECNKTWGKAKGCDPNVEHDIIFD